MNDGSIAEMKTGEGKTLVSTLAVYLNALSGKGVHVVTVNDYLANRDSQWMGKIYEFLGLKVGCVTPSVNEEERKEHVEKLKLFLEKQKLFFFRVSLSDDPEAIQIKDHILEAAKMFGFNEMTGMNKFFEQLDETIKKIEDGLDI